MRSMLRRQLAAAACAALAFAGLRQPAAAQQAPAGAPVEIQFWHGLPQPLGGMLEKIVADFNAGQQKYRVVPSFRGSYPEAMVGAIAAFRANAAPHIVQMFEVGTGTMMAAGRAIRPVHELLAQTGVTIDFSDYLPPVRGYYESADGKQMSMPFNSSTAVLWINKDQFRRAGLDPANLPKTWQEVEQAARKLKEAGIACPMTTSWPAWIQVEQLLAIHDQPLATQANGFRGLNAELRLTGPVMLRHMQNLVNWQREGLFRYGGRDAAPDGLFPSGECAMTFGSSGLRARVAREAQFEWTATMLPYYADVAGAPHNSIIGGASFWTMNKGPNAGANGGRGAEELHGVAEFFRYISRPEVDAKWHQDTGYVPVRRASYELSRQQGYYQQNPGADVPIESLLRGGEATENTRGIRLGGYTEIRNIIQEEMEKAFQGQQTAQQALEAMNSRGNAVLRNFERQNSRAH
jgi:sn-glycerol 3-phosphate transport system substrate-binding protein